MVLPLLTPLLFFNKKEKKQMRRRLYVLVATMVVTITALAQHLNVRGTVIDENKEAVIGASVMVKGSNIGTKQTFTDSSCSMV